MCKQPHLETVRKRDDRQQGDTQIYRAVQLHNLRQAAVKQDISRPQSDKDAQSADRPYRPT